MTINTEVKIGSLVGAVVTLTIVGGILYGCHEARDRFYDGQKNCIATGGTWIDRGAYAADCSRSK